MPVERRPARTIGSITFLVRDYDEAIAYFTEKLGFALLEDRPVDDGKRSVRVAASSGGTALLLARASTPEQMAQVGNQAGGRVLLFLETDDFWRDHRALETRGVSFRETPREEDYGTVVVFEDLYGNKWDLVQLKSQS